MSLPVSPVAISPSNPDRLAAPPRAVDPVAANPGAPKAPVARATGGEVAQGRTLPMPTALQASQMDDTRKNLPAGPPPAFKESLLERQARTALERPSLLQPPLRDETEDKNSSGTERPGNIAGEAKSETVAASPPPEARQAEESFAETRALEAPRQPAALDLRG